MKEMEAKRSGELDGERMGAVNVIVEKERLRKDVRM